MNVVKFFAKTSRQALSQVRLELGMDALILSNRAVDGGVEILAMAQSDLPGLTGQAMPRELHDKSAHSPQSLPSVSSNTGDLEGLAIRNLTNEIKSMRGLIEQQRIYRDWDAAQQNDPDKVKVLSDMLCAGFSPVLARQFLLKMPQKMAFEQKLNWVRAVLDHNLRTVAAADEMVERGGIYALVGPTGIGKTTTVAKIAARCVARYGTERIALLTTDSYRIGAHEQLRIYGKLLGIRVLAIKDASDLQFVLEDLRGKSLILIDTVGMSQRDQMVAEQLALLSGSGAQVQRLLLLNATSNAKTLDDVVRVYREGGLHGCIITKTDEAINIATVLDTVVRNRLTVHYVTNGQRVPEDLHLPDREYLLDCVSGLSVTSSPNHFDAFECQLLMADTSIGTISSGASLA